MSEYLERGEKEARFPDGSRIGYWRRGHEVWCTVLITTKDTEDPAYEWHKDAYHLKGDFFEPAVEVAQKGLEKCTAWFKFMEVFCGVYKNDDQRS